MKKDYTFSSKRLSILGLCFLLTLSWSNHTWSNYITNTSMSERREFQLLWHFRQCQVCWRSFLVLTVKGFSRESPILYLSQRWDSRQNSSVVLIIPCQRRGILFTFQGGTWGVKVVRDYKLNLVSLSQNSPLPKVSSSKVSPIGKPKERKSWVGGTIY